MDRKEAAMTDLVHFHVEQPAGERDRWGALFRPILALPHAIMVGGPLIGLNRREWRTSALATVAVTCAILDWFAILFTRRPIAGLLQLKRMYLGWRAHFLAYACFLRDEYPPFGDGPYPAWVELPADPDQRDVKTVVFRLFLLIPHLFVMACLLLAQAVVVLIAWLSITFTRRLNASLWRFSRDVMSYVLRVEAYGLLMHDCFPSFSLSAEQMAGEAAAPGDA
jgi:hypothetical protein